VAPQEQHKDSFFGRTPWLHICKTKTKNKKNIYKQVNYGRTGKAQIVSEKI
jgi:hypothetical protein